MAEPKPNIRPYNSQQILQQNQHARPDYLALSEVIQSAFQSVHSALELETAKCMYAIWTGGQWWYLNLGVEQKYSNRLKQPGSVYIIEEYSGSF